MTNAEARCNKSLRPRKPEGSLGRTAQDGLNYETSPFYTFYLFIFLPGANASHVYVGAWAICCFDSLISTQTPSTGLRHPSLEDGAGKRCYAECDQYPNLSEGADRVGGQLRGYKECPFSGVTNSSRVWRKAPESDARSALHTTTGAIIFSTLKDPQSVSWSTHPLADLEGVASLINMHSRLIQAETVGPAAFCEGD